MHHLDADGVSSSTCRFWAVVVGATVDSGTKLSCVAPALLDYLATSGIAADVDPNATVTVEVGVSNNGVEYSTTSGTFGFA